MDQLDFERGDLGFRQGHDHVKELDWLTTVDVELMLAAGVRIHRDAVSEHDAEHVRSLFHSKEGVLHYRLVLPAKAGGLVAT